MMGRKAAIETMEINAAIDRTERLARARRYKAEPRKVAPRYAKTIRAKEYTWVVSTAVKDRAHITSIALALKPVQKRTNMIRRCRVGDIAARSASSGNRVTSRGAASKAKRGRFQAMNALSAAIVRLIAAAVQRVCLNPRISTKTTAVTRQPVIAPSTFAR